MSRDGAAAAAALDLRHGARQPRLMKMYLGLGLGVLTCFSLGAAAATATDDPAVRELIALEEKWVQAEKMHDADTLRTILDERFIFISNGRVGSREDFIANVTKGPIDPAATQTLTDRTFLVDGDTAVVSETDHVHHLQDGKPADFALRCTTTYIRRNGRWRALAEVFSKPPA